MFLKDAILKNTIQNVLLELCFDNRLMNLVGGPINAFSIAEAD